MDPFSFAAVPPSGCGENIRWKNTMKLVKGQRWSFGRCVCVFIFIFWWWCSGSKPLFRGDHWRMEFFWISIFLIDLIILQLCAKFFLMSYAAVMPASSWPKINGYGPEWQKLSEHAIFLKKMIPEEIHLSESCAQTFPSKFVALRRVNVPAGNVSAIRFPGRFPRFILRIAVTGWW